MVFSKSSHLRDRLADQVREPLLGDLARRVPRRRVRVAAADHGVLVVDPGDAPLAEDHRAVVAVERGERLRPVVVAAGDEAADPERPEAPVGLLAPRGEPFPREPREQRVDGGLVTRDARVLVRREELVVVALRVERLHRMLQLLLGADETVLGVEPQLVHPVRPAHDRGQHLAAHVAAEHEHVRLVHRRRVQELPERARRRVQVGGEEDPRERALLSATEDHRSASSTSWYQRTRSPTRARIFQRADFGAARSARRAPRAAPPPRPPRAPGPSRASPSPCARSPSRRRASPRPRPRRGGRRRLRARGRRRAGRRPAGPSGSTRRSGASRAAAPAAGSSGCRRRGGP